MEPFLTTSDRPLTIVRKAAADDKKKEEEKKEKEKERRETLNAFFDTLRRLWAQHRDKPLQEVAALAMAEITGNAAAILGKGSKPPTRREIAMDYFEWEVQKRYAEDPSKTPAQHFTEILATPEGQLVYDQVYKVGMDQGEPLEFSDDEPVAEDRPDRSAYAELERQANALVEKKEANSFGEALELVAKRDPQLYDEHCEEIR